MANVVENRSYNCPEVHKLGTAIKREGVMGLHITKFLMTRHKDSSSWGKLSGHVSRYKNNDTVWLVLKITKIDNFVKFNSTGSQLYQ